MNDASGNNIPSIGEGKTRVITSAGTFNTHVLVYGKTESVEHEILVGMNILKHTKIKFLTRETVFSLKKNAET